MKKKYIVLIGQKSFLYAKMHYVEFPTFKYGVDSVKIIFKRSKKKMIFIDVQNTGCGSNVK